MSADMALLARGVSRPVARSYGTIVVVSGGCYGSYYVRQLRRAAVAGALSYGRLLVVDRNPRCRVAIEQLELATGNRHDREASAAEVVTAEWSPFFDEYLGSMTESTRKDADAIVPSPLMPHLMYDWLISRARTRWPTRRIERRSLEHPPAMPWQRAHSDGTHYVSFAEWICPINCIEPALCPATRGPRTWSMPLAVRAYVNSEKRRGRSLAGPVVLHCEHRAYGVGMFDTSDVLAADRLVAAAGAAGAAEVLFGTVSHCHGALSVLSIGA